MSRRVAPVRRIAWRPLVGIVVAAVAIAVVVGLTRCTSSEAGFGLPTLRTDDAAAVIERAGRTAASASGALAVEKNGCFTWRSVDGAESDADGAWIVWPDGFRHDDDHVAFDGGPRVGAGDAIDAIGAFVALEDLPDSSRDGYFGSFGRFCGADERGVLMLIEAVAG